MITPRQARLLEAILREFIETAEAVGSSNIAHKYRLGVSPATIRNEMAELAHRGFLSKPHSSSGRIPTNMSFKYFVDQLLEEHEELAIQEAQRIYESLFQRRFDQDRLIREALNLLAKESGNVALFVFGNRVYYGGLSNLTKQPEFNDINELQQILFLIEDETILNKIFKHANGSNNIHVLFGEETGLPFAKNVALLFSEVQLSAREVGYLSLIGPNRMDYEEILPTFAHVVDSINKVSKNWK